MGKSQLTLIKETKTYRRKIHLLPLVLGVIGNLTVIAVLAIYDSPRESLMLVLACLGIIAGLVSSLIPFISGCILITLMLIFASVFLLALNTLGLIGCLMIFLSGIFSIRLRKDLLSKWGW